MLENSLFFAKILNAQELGYRNDEPGQAGRYIYISKLVGDFFPPLSTTVKNDHIILDVVPDNSSSVVFTNFVYHNDKITENKIGGRNEYRLYLNEENDPGRRYYEPGDILLIQKSTNIDGPIYKLYRYSQKDKYSVHVKLKTLIERYADNSKKTSAFIPQEELSFLTLQSLSAINFEKPIITEDIKKAVFSEPTAINNLDENELTKRMRSASFRDFVLLFYNYRCAITGTKYLIEYENLSNLQAAHIHAFSRNGSDNPTNGLPLTRDLHWAFDNGFITITKDYRVRVHEAAQKTEILSQINGKELLVPEDSRALPNLDSIEWHNRNVFGLFLRKVVLKH